MASQKQQEQIKLYHLGKFGPPEPLKEGIDYEVIQQKRRDDTVKYIATIKDTLSVKEFEGLISNCGIIKRSPSPCPCKTKECEEEYLKDLKKWEDLVATCRK